MAMNCIAFVPLWALVWSFPVKGEVTEQARFGKWQYEERFDETIGQLSYGIHTNATNCEACTLEIVCAAEDVGTSFWKITLTWPSEFDVGQSAYVPIRFSVPPAESQTVVMKFDTQRRTFASRHMDFSAAVLFTELLGAAVKLDFPVLPSKGTVSRGSIIVFEGSGQRLTFSLIGLSEAADHAVRKC